MRRNNFVKCGKEHGVLAGFVRIVHANELAHRAGKLRTFRIVFERA